MNLLLKCYFMLIITFSFISSNVKAYNLNVGDTAPTFEANDENGNLWNLQNNLDQEFLVIYFYPAALTGG